MLVQAQISYSDKDENEQSTLISYRLINISIIDNCSKKFNFFVFENLIAFFLFKRIEIKADSERFFFKIYLHISGEKMMKSSILSTGKDDLFHWSQCSLQWRNSRVIEFDFFSNSDWSILQKFFSISKCTRHLFRRSNQTHPKVVGNQSFVFFYFNKKRGVWPHSKFTLGGHIRVETDFIGDEHSNWFILYLRKKT